jgi:hypothetical protein
MAPLAPIHTAILGTYGAEGQSISIPVPTNQAAFLSQCRATFRKHGHKVKLAHRQEGGALLLWAEEARTRKPRKKKEAVIA